MALSSLQPSLFTLCHMADWDMPVSSAHSAIVCVRPLAVMNLFDRLFLACNLALAHRQLSGE